MAPSPSRTPWGLNSRESSGSVMWPRSTMISTVSVVWRAFGDACVRASPPPHGRDGAHPDARADGESEGHVGRRVAGRGARAHTRWGVHAPAAVIRIQQPVPP